jgi:hypothetical protein
MTFELERFFVDVFAPRNGDVLTVMYDLPHAEIEDQAAWQERRAMAVEWHRKISAFAQKYGMRVNPLFIHEATGAHARDLPEIGQSDGKSVRLEAIIKDSTILISMPQFSATAPLLAFTKKYENLRVASMPLVSKAMEETGLSADYNKVARICAQLVPLFDQADGIEVTFSTGHKIYFDKSDHKPAHQDNGRLYPGMDTFRLRNFPSGETFVVPNESPESKTHGEIPVSYGDEIAVFVVQNNQIIDVMGDGPMANQKRQEFRAEKALRNVAEVAIGCNDKAVVTGNVLEDEKAGFHWAYGRSEFLGGTITPKDFSAPDKVLHQDIVYAKGNPIICQRFDFIFPDGTRKTAITEGTLNSSACEWNSTSMLNLF